MVGRRIDRSPERSRAVHSQSRRQATAKTTNIRAFLQTVSCSDDDRRSTHNPAQGAERARTQMVCEKEEMLAELRGARERTLGFIEETRGRNLSKYNMPHPFLGTLNAYDWLQFIASHEIRHMKQMWEIAATLPKTVTSLQK